MLKELDEETTSSAVDVDIDGSTEVSVCEFVDKLAEESTSDIDIDESIGI